MDLKPRVTEPQISPRLGISPEFSLEFLVSWVSCAMLSMMSF